MGETPLGGRYRLVDRLGEGGMSVVWRAEDLVLGRQVAVKVLAEPYAGQRHRIRAEARAVAGLSHPHIAQVFDFGDDGQHAYVVMELIDGPTLEQRLLDGPLDPPAAFRIGAQVAAALAAAHAQGLVHRDIKPANIMLTARGAKVVDFGIAAAVSPSRAKRGPDEELLGTPAYLGPERLTGSAVEPASDVYALGVLLYKMLTGELPWRAETATEILEAHLHIEPRPLPRLPDVPDEVATLFRRSLRKDPTKRPSAREAARVLSAAREPQTRRAATSAATVKDFTFFNDATVPLNRRPQWSSPRSRVTVAAMAAVVVTFGSWLLSPSSDNGALPAGPQPANAQTVPTPDVPGTTPDTGTAPGTATVPGAATPTPTHGRSVKQLVNVPVPTPPKDKGKGKDKGDDGKGKGPGSGKGPKG